MYKFINKTFYAYSMIDDYRGAGSWPEGGVDVSDEVFAEFMEGREGKKISTDSEGRPCWVDDESISEMNKSVNSNQLENLMSMASSKISPLQDAVDIGIATDEENASLLAWKKYRVALMRTDISAGEILWPDFPST